MKVRAARDPRTGPRLAAWASAVPYLWLCYVFIDVWRQPEAWGDGTWVHHCVILMVVEFFLLHSGVFIGGAAASAGTLRERLRTLGWVVGFYVAFVGAMAAISDDMSIIKIYGIAITGRLVTIAIATNDPGVRLAERSVVGAMLYVLLVPVSIFLPLPELGIDHGIARRAFPDSEGVWTEQPHRGLFMGVVYFSCMAAAELFYFDRRRPNAEDSRPPD